MDSTIDIETYELCKVEGVKGDNSDEISNIEKMTRNSGFSQKKYDKNMEMIGVKNESTIKKEVQ